MMFSSYFPPEYSGAALQALSLGKELRKRGHHIEFATQRWPGLASEDEVEGFRVTRLEAGRGDKHKELRLWWNLTRLLWHRRREFDFIHSHGAYYTHAFFGPLGGLVGMKSLVKASLADNDLHGLRSGLSGQVHYRMLRRIDACIAISRDLEREFLDGGVSPDRVHFLPNGVDTERFHPTIPEEKQALRRRLGLPTEQAIALYIGVFDRRKNIGWLMENWEQATAGAGRPLLYAVGPTSRMDEGGRFKQGLMDYAGERSDILRVGGHVNDVTDLYRAADMFVLPSLGEGLPNALLEAMACGLVCVAADVSGTRELIADGVTGALFQPHDPSSLAEALAAGFEAKSATLGEAARRRIEEGYSVHQLATRYEDLYARLKAGHSCS